MNDEYYEQALLMADASVNRYDRALFNGGELDPEDEQLFDTVEGIRALRVELTRRLGR